MTREIAPPPVVVVGLGNALLADEGIGVHVVRAAQVAAPDAGGVEFLDLGTGGLSLLHAISGRRKAIIVDCARMGEPPGAVRRFLPQQVRSAKVLPGVSLHEGDALRVLELAAELGAAPAEVVILGIEPADTSPHLDLSPALQARLGEYVAAVMREVFGNETPYSPTRSRNAKALAPENSCPPSNTSNSKRSSTPSDR